jgi:PhnB protein
MKTMIPSIAVKNCKEALEFYKGIFGGEIKNAQLADDVEMFKGHEGKYIHAELHINHNCVLYLTDIFNPNHNSGNNFQIVIELDSEEEITHHFNELAKDGHVHFPLQDTFWGANHGVVTDKFGITWGLNFTKAKKAH